MQTVKEVNLYSPTGIYCGQGSTYEVDILRLDAVVRRTVKGLFYHHQQYRLPDSYETDCWLLEQVDPNATDVMANVESIVGALVNNTPIVIGNNTFAYTYCLINELSHSSAWILNFYGRVAWLGITTPIDRYSDLPDRKGR